MKITENGLVLKEVKLRESDKILTLLTPQHGIVSASARGCMRPNNKLFSACGLYNYAEWTLHPGKNMYSVDEAAPIEVFFGLRGSIEALSLAAYIAELLLVLQPTGDEAARLLRLALNSLHMLSAEKMAPALVKAVFELRSLSEAGFMPDLLACGDCGRYEGGPFWFDGRAGMLLCEACAEAAGREPNLNPGALAALRYIVLSDDDKLFSFNLEGESLGLLCAVAEEYTLLNLDHPPKALGFLKSVLNPVIIPENQ